MTLPKIYRGTHLPHPRAELLRGAKVSIDAPIALPVQLDGEQPGTTPATFEVVPNALRLRVPSVELELGGRSCASAVDARDREWCAWSPVACGPRLALELGERASRST